MPDAALPETGPTMPLTPTVEVQDVARAGKTPLQQETIGKRLARLRKERGITQVELAAKLGVAQPMISDYERSELRLHGQLIVELTRIFDVSADELLGLETPRTPAAVRDRRLLRRLPQLARLTRRDQQAIFPTIDAFLVKAS